MVEAEVVLASSAGAEPAGAAAREGAGRESKAAAAPDNPGSQAAQAASAAAGADAPGQHGRQAEAAQPGSMPGRPGAHAGEDAAPLSLEGQPSSSDAYTGHADTGGSPPVATYTSAAERNTAHGAPLDGGVWDATDGIGGEVQTSSAQSAQSKPCSVTAAGTAAVGSSAGQLPSQEAGRQPAETGSTQSEVSSSAKAARAEKPQAAHDGQSPDVAQVSSCGPPIPSYMPFFTAMPPFSWDPWSVDIACKMAGTAAVLHIMWPRLPTLHICRCSRHVLPSISLEDHCLTHLLTWRSRLLDRQTHCRRQLRLVGATLT